VGDPRLSSGTAFPEFQKWWRSVLGPIPTLFGKLRHLSSLKSPDTGRYSHPALMSLVGTEEADRELRRAHHQVFERWISLSLEEQKADLDEYLDAAGWASGSFFYRDLPPQGARDVERQLYFADIETLLELIDSAQSARQGPAGRSAAARP
jgi:hypothetical protein